MNEAQKRMLQDYIESYEAIQTLEKNGLLDEEEKATHEHNLLFQIIKEMKLELA